jgi:hypothetical protein
VVVVVVVVSRARQRPTWASSLCLKGRVTFDGFLTALSPQASPTACGGGGEARVVVVVVVVVCRARRRPPCAPSLCCGSQGNIPCGLGGAGPPAGTNPPVRWRGPDWGRRQWGRGRGEPERWQRRGRVT